MTSWHTAPHTGLHDDDTDEQPSGMYDTAEWDAVKFAHAPEGKRLKAHTLKTYERALIESVRRQVEEKQRGS